MPKANKNDAKTAPIKSDVVIVGAGVPGALCALILARDGLKVTVIEAAPYPQSDSKTPKKAARPDAQDALAKALQSGRTVALMERACGSLERFGVMAEVSALAAPLRSLRIIDDSYWPATSAAAEGKWEARREGLSRGTIDEIFHAHEIGQDQFGYNIPLDPLRRHMLDLLAAHDSVTLLCDAGIEQIDFPDQQNAPSSVTIRLKDGQTCIAPLVIGADGRASVVREAAGIGLHSSAYDAAAITCLLSHTQNHEDTSTEFHRPSGPFTLVPLQGKRSSLVWVDRTDRVAQFMALPQDALRDAIQERTHGLLGRVDLMTKPQSWPLINARAACFTAPRCALLAEAAHVLSPIGAQGMNLSLRDVEDLTDTIRNAAYNGLDIGSMAVLEGYAKKRKADMAVRGLGVDAFHRGVATDNPLIHRVRRSGLQAISACLPLRLALMREGLSPRARHG